LLIAGKTIPFSYESVFFLAEGDKVTFDVAKGPKGLQAADVKSFVYGNTTTNSSLPYRT
jgi:hypothetical protein